MSKNEKRYENSVNDERCRRYFIYAVWLYNSQNNATPNKDEETVPAMESLSHETYTESTKLTASSEQSSVHQRGLSTTGSMLLALGWGPSGSHSIAIALRSVLGHGLPFPHVRCEMLTLCPCPQTWTSPNSCSLLWLSDNVGGGTDVSTYVQAFAAQIMACIGKFMQWLGSGPPQGFLLPGTALSCFV